MIRYFICLANSKKYGERCIAGIEINLNKERDTYRVVHINDVPRWIRPVSNSEHGEVLADLVSNIQLNDVVELNIVAESPRGYQCENMLFDPKSIKKANRIKLSEKALNNLVQSNQLNLFGNKGKAVYRDSIGSVTCSITFIKIEVPEIYLREDYNKPQLRMKFLFNTIPYDLPITDLGFIDKYNEDSDILENVSYVYLTISLGVKYQEWHSKLVARVVLI